MSTDLAVADHAGEGSAQGMNIERLKAVMQVRGIRQGELARKLGVSQTIVSRICTGRMRSTTYVYAVARALSVSSEYLMGDSDLPDPNGESAAGLNMLAVPSASDTVQIAQGYLRSATAKSDLDTDPLKKMRCSREWLAAMTSTAPEHLLWTENEGGAMEPTIRHGEVVLVDRSRVKPSTNDGIWAVVHGKVGLVRRLRLGSGEAIELHSDNQLLRPAIVKADELEVVGQVVAIIKKL